MMLEVAEQLRDVCDLERSPQKMHLPGLELSGCEGRWCWFRKEGLRLVSRCTDVGRVTD
jgi:hypothetical protein